MVPPGSEQIPKNEDLCALESADRLRSLRTSWAGSSSVTQGSSEPRTRLNQGLPLLWKPFSRFSHYSRIDTHNRPGLFWRFQTNTLNTVVLSINNLCVKDSQLLQVKSYDLVITICHRQSENIHHGGFIISSLIC